MIYDLEIVIRESATRRISASDKNLCKITEYASNDWTYDFNDGVGWNRPLIQVTRVNESIRVIVKKHEGPWHCDLYFNKTKILPTIGGKEGNHVGTHITFKLLNVHRIKVLPRTIRPPLKRVVEMPVFDPPENCVFPSATKLPEDMVSIIVLTYNTFEMTVRCVKAVLARTVHPFELFVVDNASLDETVSAFESQHFLTLIVNTSNLGFSKANNIAIKRARGKYICLLNSDVIVKGEGWLKHMVEYAETSPLVGTVGAKLLSEDNKIQHIGGGIHHTNPYHPYEKQPANTKAADISREVPYNTGACLLITRVALNKAGLLDEDYPFGFEDVDYGLRVVEQGLKNIYCPEAVLIHFWAYTQRKTNRYIPMVSLARYHSKWDMKLPEIAKKVKLSWGAPYYV